jgi:hypothetical protein
MLAITGTLVSSKPPSQARGASALAYLRSAQMRPFPPRQTPLFSLPKEPEDAFLTGGTRSLDRRLLALNLNGTLDGTRTGLGRTRSAPLNPPLNIPLNPPLATLSRPLSGAGQPRRSRPGITPAGGSRTRAGSAGLVRPPASPQNS